MIRRRAVFLAFIVVGLLCLPLAPSTSHGSSNLSPASESVAAKPALSAAAGVPTAFTTGMAASTVIGAPNFTTYWSTPNASALAGSDEYSALDAQGDLWVTDFSANRVLEFRPPFASGEAASLVIGQSTLSGTFPGTTATNLSGPAGVAFDSRGDLWVNDYDNNRLLEFRPPFTDGMSASLVLGQQTFKGNQAATSAVNVSGPVGPTFDALGDLWVADQGNNRVLEFVPPFASGMHASVVLGQTSMTGSSPGLTNTNLSGPQQAVASGDWLFVADSGNDRVLGFPAPFADGEGAELVLGQAGFDTDTSVGEAATAYPVGVTVDSFGNLWVSDWGHSRVLEFTPPWLNFENPAVAIGQSNLTGDQSGLTATNLSFPQGVAFDARGDLWVTDAGNNRVLEYVPALTSLTLTESGLPAGTHWSVSLDGVVQSGSGPFVYSELNGTYSFDVTPVPGYRADPSSGTLAVNGTTTVTIAFTPTAPNPFSIGMPASLVLGQPNFDSSFGYTTANASELALGGYAAVFDSSGDLWVADAEFERVLEFRPPFTNFMAASLVIGQSNFEGTLPGDSATNLSFPDGIAFDSAGDLWVSDYDNNRVLEFVPPFTDGMSASVVLGQPGFGVDTGGFAPNQLRGPAGLAFQGSTLWVTDYNNNRVLEFPAPLLTGENATRVLGQSNLTGSEANISATNLSEPTWISFDPAGDAWVTDYGNNRVVEFPSPLTTGEAATVVVGEPNLTAQVSAFPSSLFGPNEAWFDEHGNLWVADSDNNRVVEYPGPASSIRSNETAIGVLGQGNLSTHAAATSRTGLSFPTEVFGDAQGDIWVFDANNARILEYGPARFDLNFTVSGLAAGSNWSVTFNGASPYTTNASIESSLVNGSYAWTAGSQNGYIATPTSSVAELNGATLVVPVDYVPFTYSVTFTESGLPSGTSWTVTLNGAPHTTTSSSITLQEPNGSYAYTILPVAGYSSSVSSGNVEVSAAPAGVAVTFTPSSVSPIFSNADFLVVGAVAVAVVAIAVVLLLRRRKGAAPPTGPAGSSPSPPAGAVGPPPAAPGPPPPPPGGG